MEHLSLKGMLRYFRYVQVVLTFLCGLALVASFFNLHPAVPYIAVLFGSYFALTAAWESLKSRSIDVNFLMVLAAIGAVVVGRAIDAAALLFLFSLSSTLESLAMARTRNAIEGLIRLRPDTAIRIGKAGDERVPVEGIALEDLVRVPPYETVPVDGEVVQGQSSVNQSAMTGESQPVNKSQGDLVLGGTQNLDAMLVVRATSVVGNSTLDRIVELVRDAQENKASGERISSWFGQWYTILVFGVFCVSLVVRLLLHAEWGAALYQSLVLLVALSPCALVISTPASTLSALAWAARNGILVRGGEFIENSGYVDSVALDKTGTLTTGKPELVEVCVCSGATVSVGAGSKCVDDEACWHRGDPVSPAAAQFLRAAAAAEQYSSHPIADAIVTAARLNGVDVPEVDEQTALPGLGVSAILDGKRVLVGQIKLLQQEIPGLPPEFVEHAKELQREGSTVALIAYGDEYAALALADAPREDARRMLGSMKALGVKRVAMITGDTPETAHTVAKELGIEEVHAGLLPDEKTQVIREMVARGERVMMVGDGINDAPSLAMASVGVAMGGLGSDIALKAADVVLVHDNLDRIPALMALGRRTNSIVRANLFFAAGVIIALTISSLFFKLPLPIAVVGHEGSTVVVILNGLRLLGGARVPSHPI